MPCLTEHSLRKRGHGENLYHIVMPPPMLTPLEKQKSYVFFSTSPWKRHKHVVALIKNASVQMKGHNIIIWRIYEIVSLSRTVTIRYTFISFYFGYTRLLDSLWPAPPCGCLADWFPWNCVGLNRTGTELGPAGAEASFCKRAKTNKKCS